MESEPQRKKVAVFRAGWIAGSETFIRRQLDAITRYDAVGFGLEKVTSANSRSTDLSVFTARPLHIARRLFGVTRRSAAVSRFLREHSPALVHAHFGFDGTLIEPVTRRLGIPLLVTFHGMDASVMLQDRSMRSRLYRSRLRRLLLTDTQLIAVSEHIARQLVGFGANPSRVTVAYIGAPAEDGDVASHDTRRGVLFAGRLAEKKGVATLIRAWADVDEGIRREHSLTIVGSGALSDELQSLAAELVTDGSIEFCSWVKPDELANMMQEAAVFAVPSQTASDGDTEGLPTVVLEAALRGAALMGTVHAGTPEFVRNGEDGILVAERDSTAMAGALESLLADRALRQTLSDSARRRAMTEFDMASRTAVLEDIYDRVSQRRA